VDDGILQNNSLHDQWLVAGMVLSLVEKDQMPQ
jgi:hypothetical protein